MRSALSTWTCPQQQRPLTSRMSFQARPLPRHRLSDYTAAKEVHLQMGSEAFRSTKLAWLASLGVGMAAPALAANATSEQMSDDQWVMPSKDYAATRYSALNQITRTNAHGLHPVWTF